MRNVSSPLILKLVVLLVMARWAMADVEGVDIYRQDNLVAWCIVPFDAAKRGPKERAEMLQRLGFGKVAYDWRAEHVPSFEAEILAYKEHHLEFFAFWDWHPALPALIEKHGIRPQIWKMISNPKVGSQQEKVEVAAKEVLPLVEETRKLGCQLGLYNHGGWSGEPKNLVAVCEWLRKNAEADHVGIVYNFHHGHAHIDDFGESLRLMQPYLLCLNLNGMNDGAKPKILPLGQGEHEQRMMRTVLKSGFQGPFGLLDHRPELDAEKSLRENLDGLKKIREALRSEITSEAGTPRSGGEQRP